MLKQIRIRLAANGNDIAHYNWGSLMHGVIMEGLEFEYAQQLHSQGLKPIHQYILPESTGSSSREAIWVLNLLGERSVAEILPSLKDNTNIFIKHKDITFKVLSIKEEATMTEDEFCSYYLVRKYPQEKISMTFLTPCSHKSSGRYCIFPSEDLIIRSLAQKWNAYAKNLLVDDEEAIEQLVSRTRVINYNLKSTSYHLESIRIPSYIGKITLSTRGPIPLLRLANMLLFFSNFSGIGVKTFLGMGACKAY